VSEVQGVFELQRAVTEVVSKALAEMQEDVPGMGAMAGLLKEQISASLNAESMELMLQDLFLLRPMEPVGKGGIWENTYTATGATPHQGAVTYTLDETGTPIRRFFVKWQYNFIRNPGWC